MSRFSEREWKRFRSGFVRVSVVMAIILLAISGYFWIYSFTIFDAGGLWPFVYMGIGLAFLSVAAFVIQWRFEDFRRHQWIVGVCDTIDRPVSIASVAGGLGVSPSQFVQIVSKLVSKRILTDSQVYWNVGAIGPRGHTLSEPTEIPEFKGAMYYQKRSALQTAWKILSAIGTVVGTIMTIINLVWVLLGIKLRTR